MSSPLRDPADLRIAPGRDGWTNLHSARRVPLMRYSHRHDELEVNLVLDGWAEYLVGDRRVRFPRHGLGWLLPSQTHRLIDRADELQMWIGVFRPSLLPDGPDDIGPPRDWLRRAPQEDTVRVISEHAAALAALFAQLATDDISPARHRLGLAWLLSECWRVYCHAPTVPAGIHLHPAVEFAARWLHDYAAEPEADDLPGLAGRCGVSRPWLSKLFQHQLGESLTDFRNRQRFHRFRALLAEPAPRSLTDAAFAAGFGSYAQCYRIVRHHAGQSPRELAAHVHGREA